MPRIVPDALWARLSQQTQTWCYLLKITPAQASAFGMTTLDVDFTYDDGSGPVTYVARHGIDAYDVDLSNGAQVNNSQADTLAGDVYDAGMTKDGVIRGDYDDADFVLYLIDYAHPEAGHVIIQSGRLGQVTMVDDTKCSIELRGLTDILRQNNLIGLTSITDRAMLGDDHNKVTLRWYDGTVATVGAESDRVFSSSVTPGSDSVIGGGLSIPLPGGDGGPGSNWTIDGGSMSMVTNDPRYQYLESSSSETTAHRDVTLPAQVQAGDNLMLSWLIQGTPGAGRTIQVWIEFPGTSAGTFTNGAQLVTADWVAQSVSAAVPAGAATIRITLQFEPQGQKAGMNVRSFALHDTDYSFGGATDVSVLHVPFFSGDGTTTTAQLLDTSGDVLTSGFTVQTIEVDGAVLDGSAYTVSATGLVTFTTAPIAGAQVTWSGSLTAQPSGFFAPGVVHWDSGWNIGLEREVESYDASTGTVTLAIPCPFAIQPGDAFRIRRDYGGSITEAKDVFDCLLNFRGEPWLPRGNAIDLQAPTPQQS